jgi:hypothetical protein
MMNNTCPPRFTAAAGTKLAGAHLWVMSCFFPTKRTLQPAAFIIHVTLLDQAFAHCPRFPTADLEKFGPYFNPNVIGRPLRPTEGLRLGRPLPYQLPDPVET